MSGAGQPPRESCAPDGPRWHIWVLVSSCIHSGVWSLFIILAPETSARVYGFASTPVEIHLWQGTGFFIGLLAFGYALAAANPRQHWGLVLFGLIAKTAGAVGMTRAVWLGQVSRNVLTLIPINDVIWWLPFFLIVRHYRQVTRGRQAPTHV